MTPGGRPVRRVLASLVIAALVGGCTGGGGASSGAAAAASPSPSAVAPTPAPTLAPTPAPTLAPTPTTIASAVPSASASSAPTIGQPADDGARIIAVTPFDARARDLTIDSPAVGTVTVRLLLPSDYDAKPSARWPLLYLLHGADQEYWMWTAYADVEELTAPTDLLVVMPEGGSIGYYSDWWNGGAGGPPMWETFHLVELRQLLERNWRAGDKRAIAGLSMGGYGAMEYAARRPGMFVFAASFSGALDPLGAAMFDLPGQLWGDPTAQADVWKAHDPTDIAATLQGTALYVAFGNGKPGPLEVGVTPPPGACSDEAFVAAQSDTFLRALTALKIPVTVDAYGPGCHGWVYWQRDLHRSLPFLLKALGE